MRDGDVNGVNAAYCPCGADVGARCRLDVWGGRREVAVGIAVSIGGVVGCGPSVEVSVYNE